MAGIIVSGGTYSGSGDVTTDYVKIMNVANGWFIAPDGDLTLVGQSGGYSLNAVLPTGASAGFHSNGGTVVFDNTVAPSYHPLVQVDGFNGYGHFCNVTVSTDITRYHTRIKASGNLTINAGATFESSRAAYTTNNTYVDFEGDLYVAGTFGNTVGDKLDSDGVGDAFGSVNIAGGTLNACSGNTTINYKSGLYSVIYRNNGTMVHNSGTMILNPNTDVVFGGGGGAGGLWNVIATERGAGTYTYRVYNSPIIEHDLTVSGAVVYNNNLAGGMNHTVSGNVSVVSGASYANTGAAANTQTFGSLYIDSASTFVASPSGFLTLTDEGAKGGSDYAVYIETGGVFTHNDGTVTIEGPKADTFTEMVWRTSNQLYNFNCWLTAPCNSLVISNNEDATGIVIANDLNVIAAKTFKTFGGASNSRPIVVSGTATISGTLGVATEESDWTFGALDVIGTYIAPQGTTKLYGKTGVTYTQTGTYTHNDGLFYVSGGSQQMKWGDALHGPFYDLKSDGTGNEFRGAELKVENSFIIESGYVSPSYNGGSGKVWTLGTATSPAYISGTAAEPLKVWDSTASHPFTVQAYNSVYPVELKGYEWDWKLTAGASYPQSIKFGGVDCQFNINTTNGNDDEPNEFKLIDQSSFQDITVEKDSTFDCSGQRFECLKITTHADGTVISDNSLMVVNNINSDGGWTGEDTTDIMSNGATNYDFSTPSTAANRIRTWLSQGDGNSSCGSGRLATKTIVGKGKLLLGNNMYNDNPSSPYVYANLSIANGGEFKCDGFTSIFDNTFSNRGGLFASSSAVDLTATTQSVLIPTSADFDDNPFDGGGTMEWWVNLDADGVGTERGNLFSMWTTQLRAYFLDQSGDTCKIRFVQKFSGDNPEWETGQSIPIGKWVHIAITYDNDDPANDPLLYIDGKLTYFPNNNPAGGSRQAVGGYPLYLGNDSTGNDTLDGRIGMFRYFKTTIRTPAQIRTDMFNQYSDMDNTTGLKCMLQFDEGEGTTVTDVSTQSNNATLENSLGWATGGTWTAGEILSGSSQLYIGNRGSYATEFGSSYFPTGNINFVSGAKFVSKAHSGTSAFYVDAADGATFEFDKMSLEPNSVDRTTHLGGNDMELLSGDYTYIFNDGENDQGTAKDTETLTVYSPVTVNALTGVDFYVQDFVLKPGASYPRTPTYDGVIHDDGSLPQEYEPIDFKQHVDDTPIDAGLAID